jgi:hypothetical protein
MRRRYLMLAPAAAAAVFALRSTCGESSAPAHAPAASVRGARLAAPRRGGGTVVSRARYHLAFDEEVAVPGKPSVKLRAAGAWFATQRPDGRTEVRFSPAELAGSPSELPRAADLEASAQLVREGGVLKAIGFPDEMPAKARKFLTGLATTFQLTDGSGDGWTVAEEDLTGRYDAVYARSGDELRRSRPRYSALRGPAGPSEDAAGATPAEQTRFVVDVDGIVTASVELDVTFALGKGMDPAKLQVRAHLEREAIEQVDDEGIAAFAAGPISGFADFETARRNADESFVAGASLDDLLAEVKRSLGMSGSAGGNARAQVLARLGALVRLRPEAAAEIAEQLRRQPGDIAELGLLAGALGSARIAAGTNALAGLLGGELPDDARSVVAAALSLSSPATPASLRALTEGLDRPHGDAAALGLGAHGRWARDKDPAAADAAVDVLLDRHASAHSDAERRLYLEALGNAGAPRALPVLRAAIDGGDRRLGRAAVFSLRFVPGADADALIERSLTQPALAFAAVRAAGYRDPARWRPLLLAAQEQYPEHNGIQGEIRAILRRWSNNT